jgi:hypothetical protein
MNVVVQPRLEDKRTGRAPIFPFLAYVSSRHLCAAVTLMVVARHPDVSKMPFSNNSRKDKSWTKSR